MKNFTSPVAIIVYNRLYTVKKLISVLNKVKISKLYVIADGPKNPSDKIKCQKVISYIKKHAKASEVIINSSKNNLGLQKRIVTGLDWVFSQEERAIILEDDCIPDPSFFMYCDDLLVKYQKNKRVISIAGYNSKPYKQESSSYHFSKFIETWGWATWRRSWNQYEHSLIDWSPKKFVWLKEYLGSWIIAKYWSQVFTLTKMGKINSWGYRFQHAAFKNRGLTIVPHQNLIANLGFGDQATNTKHSYKLPSVGSFSFPLNHETTVKANIARDQRVALGTVFNIYALGGLIKAWLSKV